LSSVDRWVVSGGRVGRHGPPDTNQRSTDYKLGTAYSNTPHSLTVYTHSLCHYSLTHSLTQSQAQ